MAAPPPSKADHRFQVFLILCLWIFVGYLWIFVGQGVFFTDLVGPGGEDTSSNQKKDQKEYLKDRNDLSQGTANAYYPKTVQVDESFKIELAVCGSPVAVCLIDKGTNTQITKSQPLGVGAYISAKLSSPSKNLTVNSDGNGERPVFKPTETQQWEWSLTAARPDTYDLTIELTPQRTGGKSFGTVLVQHITITAEDTAATWSARAAGRISAFFSSVGGALAAQFAAVVGFLVYRHSKRNSPAPAAQALPPVQQQPTPPSAPTVARRAPPKPRQPVATTPRNGARKRR